MDVFICLCLSVVRDERDMPSPVSWKVFTLVKSRRARDSLSVWTCISCLPRLQSIQRRWFCFIVCSTLCFCFVVQTLPGWSQQWGQCEKSVSVEVSLLPLYFSFHVDILKMRHVLNSGYSPEIICRSCMWELKCLSQLLRTCFSCQFLVKTERMSDWDQVRIL